MKKVMKHYHGCPYDRGGADAYYGRPKDPHKYPNGSYNGPRVTKLTRDELTAYHIGYAEMSKQMEEEARESETS